MSKPDPQPRKRGPKPETIKAEGVDWEDALAHALKKPPPKEGWPESRGKGKPGPKKDQ